MDNTDTPPRILVEFQKEYRTIAAEFHDQVSEINDAKRDRQNLPTPKECFRGALADPLWCRWNRDPNHILCCKMKNIVFFIVIKNGIQEAKLDRESRGQATSFFRNGDCI